jgi:hypothetical protein
MVSSLYVHTCRQAYMYACMNAYMYIHIHANGELCICTYIHIHTRACTYLLHISGANGELFIRTYIHIHAVNRSMQQYMAYPLKHWETNCIHVHKNTTKSMGARKLSKTLAQEKSIKSRKLFGFSHTHVSLIIVCRLMIFSSL